MGDPADTYPVNRSHVEVRWSDAQGRWVSVRARAIVRCLRCRRQIVVPHHFAHLLGEADVRLCLRHEKCSRTDAIADALACRPRKR